MSNAITSCGNLSSLSADNICPACGKLATAMVLPHPACQILRCTDCNIALTIPKSFITTSSYDSNPDLAAGYERGEADGFRYSNLILDSLGHYVPKGKLLDVGCSIGTLVHAAQHRGYESQGIDLDGNAIGHGVAKGRPIAKSSVGEWPVSDYDALVLQHTLEHVPEPVAFLKQCVARLESGGVVIASVPCYCGLLPKLFGHRWYGWQLNQHYFHYSKSGLRKVFELSGLTVLRAFTNSMDHSIRPGNIHGIKQWILTVAAFVLARVGSLLGRGDQLMVIGRKTISASTDSRLIANGVR